MREAYAKLAQPSQFIQFLLGIAGLPLAAQGEGEIVVGLLEIRLQFDSATKGRDRSSDVAPCPQLPAQVILGLRIIRIQRHRHPKLFQCVVMVTLTAQSHAQHEVGGCKPRIEVYRQTKLCNGVIQLAELAFNCTKLQVSIRRGLQPESQT